MSMFTPDKVCNTGFGPKSKKSHVKRLWYILGTCMIEMNKFTPENIFFSEIFVLQLILENESGPVFLFWCRSLLPCSTLNYCHPSGLQF